MNLKDFNTNKMKAKRFHKIFESRFGRKINFDNMTSSTAVKLVNKLDESIAVMKKSTAFQRAEKSPRYAETLMLKEGLDNWLHVRLGISHKRKLTEGEIEQAEAVLAAKDFVDRLQKMLEDVGRIINEDLPPLSDVIRDQMGSDVATSYVTSASTALMAIQTSISTGRQELDSAARILAGEEDAIGGMEMGAGDELGMDDDLGDLDAELGDDGIEGDLDLSGGDEFDMDDGAIGGDLELGREVR